jgi:hypothetical protein
MKIPNIFQKYQEYNNAQKATGALIALLICVNILPATASLAKTNQEIPALLSLAAQIFFVMFVYFSLIWLGKK